MPTSPRHTWWRFYTEMCGDLKIRKLAPAQRWIWCAVLSAARTSPQPGRLYVGELPMDTADIAEHAAVKVKDVQPALDAMVKLHMLSIEDGVIVVVNWDARQYESDSSTNRVRAHRERSRNGSGNVPRNGERNVSVTPRNGALRNAPETETETETEKEKDGARKRGTRLPENWTPNAEDVAWARTEKITDFVQRRETEIFVDYWHSIAGAKAVKLDWSLTWRNWLRRVNNEVTPPARVNGAPSTFGGW